MNKTPLILVLAALIGLVTVHPVRADRPGSYDQASSGRATRGPSHSMAHYPQRPQRGPLRPEYRGPHQRSSVSLFVGTTPGYYYWPWYGYGGYYPFASYAYWGPTGIYYDSASNYAQYNLPPIYAPAELAYGPLAVERFLGAGRDPIAVPPAAPPALDAPAAGDAVADDAKEEGLAAKLRKSNDAARQRARRFLEFGDALFEHQRFHEALQRYKSAIESAPDLAEAYYREGFALIAVSQYRLATKALRIAVELDPDMPGDDFQLDHLYKDNQLAKNAHLEQLSGEGLNRAGNGDLLFLVGMFLYCDGEIERAHKFLQRAVETGGPGATFISPLLEADPVPAASSPAKRGTKEIDI